MKLNTVFLYVFVYGLVCPISSILGHVPTQPTQRTNHDTLSHSHPREKPCDVCPRHGRCVVRIQCPAHLRSGSYNPECHLDKGHVGICCFTGSGHAAESDHKLRSASSITSEDMKRAHLISTKKLSEWLDRAQTLMKHADVVVNESAPSFAHHLSMVTHDGKADELGHGGLLNLFAAQELKSRQSVSDDQLALGLTAFTDGPFCRPPSLCPSASRYRSVDGSCNNQAFPSWGASNTGFERLLPPDYSDGIWAIRASSSGLPLPSARLVSQALLLDSYHPSPTHNLMFMQLGQFIAHDTSAGVVFTLDNKTPISCCSNDGEDFLPPQQQHWGCAPITVDPEDPFYGPYGHKCINFVRTQLAPASDCSVTYAKQVTRSVKVFLIGIPYYQFDGRAPPSRKSRKWREWRVWRPQEPLVAQVVAFARALIMNGATHFLDLSHLYGSSQEKVKALQGPGGLLKVFNDYGRELPPLAEKKDCMTEKDGAACFDSGDNHGNQILSLTVLHTIFTREHNRIARALNRLNPDWNENQIYFEARRIVQAEFQHIIYNEWLPLLLGPQIIQLFDLSPSSGYSSSYDPHVNPSLTAEFSSAAMRFGHSVVDGKLIMPSSRSKDVYETVFIPEVMFQPSRLRLRYLLDRMLIGLSRQPMQRVDPFVSEGLTRYLFHGGNPFGLDLASINIQRGRDWGVRSYNEFRRLTGLQPYTDFAQYNPNAAQRLSSVYSSPEDLDLWIGGLLEEPVEGGVVGPTFAHIIADQFSRFKRGDRYFYENGPDVNPGAFSPSQLSEIKKVTLSRIICDNRDRIELFLQSPNAFLRADLPGNEAVPCESHIIPSMDLSRFKEL